MVLRSLYTVGLIVYMSSRCVYATQDAGEIKKYTEQMIERQLTGRQQVLEAQHRSCSRRETRWDSFWLL